MSETTQIFVSLIVLIEVYCLAFVAMAAHDDLWWYDAHLGWWNRGRR